MKTLLRRLLGRFGLNVVRASPSPYEHLLALPRYAPTRVDLLGRHFEVPDGTSFVYSHREIFAEELYRFDAVSKSPRIIDCGANCGLAVVFWKHAHPDARILAVEADPALFEVLRRNVQSRALAGVELLAKAVGATRGRVPFHSEGADGGRIHALDGARATLEVESVLLDDLIDGPVDFLKIDIEGAETGAVCASQKLGSVRQMFVEYHSFADAPQTLPALLEKLSSVGFRYFIRTQFCSPRPLTERARQLGMDLQLNIFATRV